jgi:pimeloyl-ACP methyl ester carboxylesterase
MMLTSPWPESLYTFMHVWPRLSTMASGLASDLPGFGRSERRTDPLSPLAMSPFIVGLLDSWEIGEPHLVSPDVGTSAARFAAGNYAGRFRSLVVGTDACAFPISYVGLSLSAIMLGFVAVRAARPGPH